MPTPKQGESESDFISRCVEIVMDEEDVSGRDQATAMCYSYWNEAKKSDGDDTTASDDTADDADQHTMTKSFEQSHVFFKAEEHDDYTLTLGAVLIPEEVDSQGDIISAEEIELSAHDFLEDSRRLGYQHKMLLGSKDVQVVESYVARTDLKVGKNTIPAGTWMLGARIYDDQLRKMIREGELTGYSIGGTGKSVEEPDES